MAANAPSIESMHREFCEFRQEFREGQGRQIEILENIARQTVRMDHFRADIDKLEDRTGKEMGEVFNRIRDLEKSPGIRAVQKEDKRRENIFMGKVAGIASLVSVTVGVLLDKVV